MDEGVYLSKESVRCSKTVVVERCEVMQEVSRRTDLDRKECMKCQQCVHCLVSWSRDCLVRNMWREKGMSV